MKAKTCVEFNLVSAEGQHKMFLQVHQQKGEKKIKRLGKTRENMGTELNEMGTLVAKDMKKTKVLNVFFALVFLVTLVRADLRNLRPLRLVRKEILLLVEEDQVREQLKKLNIHKSMGPDRIYPKVLRNLVSVILRVLSIVFETWW